MYKIHKIEKRGLSMKKELKNSELNKISGGIKTKITQENEKWKFSALWGSEVMSAEFDTEEEAQEYEKEVVALAEMANKRKGPWAYPNHALEMESKFKSSIWGKFALWFASHKK